MSQNREPHEPDFTSATGLSRDDTFSRAESVSDYQIRPRGSPLGQAQKSLGDGRTMYGVVSPDSLPRLSDAAHRLVKNVKFRDIEGFVRHANLNLELFREDDLRTRYLGETVEALIERRQPWARNCVEKFLLVKECSRLSTAGRTQFLQKLYHEDEITVENFDDMYDRTMQYCRDQAEKRQRGASGGDRQRTPSNRGQDVEDIVLHSSALVIGKGKTKELSTSAERRPHRLKEDSGAVSEEDDLAELRGMPSLRHDSTFHKTQPPRHETNMQLDRHAAESSGRSDDDDGSHWAQSELKKAPSYRGDQGQRARLEDGMSFKLDAAYRKMDPRSASSFFKVGKAFAILEHSEDSGALQHRSNDSWSTETHSGIVITSHVRRFIVVKEGHGFCWAVGINTYGGQGVRKKGLNKKDRDAHAIAYNTGSQPVRLRDEPTLLKDPIEIHPVSRAGKVERLDAASRIDFSRVRTVEHNVRVKHIGEVARSSLPYLRSYWIIHRDE